MLRIILSLISKKETIATRVADFSKNEIADCREFPIRLMRLYEPIALGVRPFNPRDARVRSFMDKVARMT